VNEAQPPWWRRSRSAARAGLYEAAGQAAAALVELDALQRQVELRRTLNTQADTPERSASWYEVRRQADAAIQGYLRVLERYDIEADLDEDDAFRARELLSGCHYMLRQAIEAIRRLDL
jgi:hypothetical protein